MWKTGWRLKSLQLPPLVLNEDAVTAAVAAVLVRKKVRRLTEKADTVMHMNFPVVGVTSTTSSASRPREGMVLNPVKLVDNLSVIWPRSFRRRNFAVEPVYRGS